jgi:4'-phosphopantetheinyl transferase
LNLSSSDVHLWRAWLDQPGWLVQRFTQTLSKDEQQRAGRFHFASDRRRFVVGRAILRAILGQYLGVEPGQVQFSYGPKGKPSLLQRDTQLCFNVSHSRELVLYAVTLGREVGVDVEYIRPMSDAEQITERFFSPQECAAFSALPAEQKPEGFFNCWTRKEAYLKACGDGITRPLDQFSVSLIPGEPARLLRVEGDSGETSRWRLKALTPAPDYVAAIAVAGINWQLACWTWSE